MKILLALSLVFYTVNGFRFSNIFSQNEEIKPLSICTGVADGTRLPDETNCQRFTLCDGGNGLLLSCRTAEPHFYRCNSTCVNDTSVCQIKECPGDTTTTSTTTTSTTTSTTTTPTTTTTTRFSPPTVPISLCNPTCRCTDTTTFCDCECVEQYVCKADLSCGCDDTIKCPMDKETCIKPEGCGCEERCACTGTVGAEICTCKEDVTCPFDDPELCVEKCGCARNCDCQTVGTVTTCTCVNDGRQCPFNAAECMLRCGCLTNCDRISFSPLAVCLEPCRCQDAYLCPFDQSQCIANCKCKERCVTTGTLTRCDPDIVCTRNAHDFFRNFWHEN